MFESLKKSISEALRPKKSEFEETIIKFDFDGLSVRVGSELVVKDNTGLIYGSTCIKPDTNIINGIGITKIHRSTLYRLYFGPEYFVQILIDASNKIEECRLYRLVKIEQPSSAEEWEKWLLNDKRANKENKDCGIIGKDEVFYNNISYCRLESWASPDPAWVEPLKLTEVKHCLSDIFSIDHEVMAYGRWLNEENEIAEYLIISSEELAKKEDMYYNTHKECSIHFYVGIDIAFDSISSSF